MRGICIFCILITAFCSICISQDNIISNPGFENVEENLPVNWAFIGWFKPEVKFAIDRDKSNKGKNSASILITELTDRLKEFGPPNWAQNITDNIPLGKTIRLDAIISTRKVKGIAVIAVQCLDRDGQLAGFGTTQYDHPVSGDTEWTNIGFNMKVPDNTKVIRVLCMLSGTGQAWFDDIRISEAN
jgi:hypothetical protein